MDKDKILQNKIDQILPPQKPLDTRNFFQRNKTLLIIIFVVLLFLCIAVNIYVRSSLKKLQLISVIPQTVVLSPTPSSQFLKVFNHGSSMEPSYQLEQSVSVDTEFYKSHQPQRGDVVLFKTPGKENIEVLKRIIGLPNEVLEIKNGNVYINGQIIQEPYLKESNLTYIDNVMDIFMRQDSKATITNNSYFVMGDNRKSSSDSRSFGLVNIDHIIGKVE